MTVITVGGYAIYCYVVLLGWVAVGLLCRQWAIERFRLRDVHHGADEAYGDELYRIREFLSGEAQVPIVAPSPILRWQAPTGEQPIVADPVTYGRRRRPVAPRMTRTVVPVAPPPAWAAGYQPGPITREFARIVGTEFPTWTQAELDLEAVGRG